MAYDLKLKSASFRGVSFGVTEHSMGFGRRGVVHEFPQRSVPYVEDMGKKARSYNIEAYVIGADYQAQRDKLISALEEKGPGKLVHPWLGTLTVQILDGCQLRESWDNGGMAVISFPCSETQEISYPEVDVSSVDAVASAADTAEEAIASALDDGLNITSTPIVSALQDSAEAIGETVSSGLLSDIAKFTTKLAAFTKKVSNFITDIAILARKPLSLAYAIINMVKTLASSATEAYSVVAAYKRLFDTLDTTEAELNRNISAKTSFGSKVVANNTKLVNGTKAIVAVEAARAAIAIAYGYQVRTTTPAVEVASGATAEDQVPGPGQVYVTGEDIMASRETVNEMLETVIETATDAVFEALTDLQHEIAIAPLPSQADVRYLKKITLNDTMPSLVLSYQLYGSLDQAEDIVARNKIRHPAVCPNGEEMEVVTK